MEKTIAFKRTTAAIIAQANYEKYLLHRQAEAQIGLEKFLERIHPRVDPNISDEDLEAEIVDAIHEMRGVHYFQ